MCTGASDYSGNNPRTEAVKPECRNTNHNKLKREALAGSVKAQLAVATQILPPQEELGNP
jgi:hypothetical protein